MFGRVKHFLERSIRNKMLVVLPLILALVLFFFYFLSILTLREKVYASFVEEARRHLSYFSLLVSPLGPQLSEEALRNRMPEYLLYLQIYDDQGRLVYRYASSAGARWIPQSVPVSEPGREGLRSFKKISLGKIRALEIREAVDGRFLLAAFSRKHLDQLLFSQTVLLSVIALIAVVAMMIAIASLSHLVTGPIRKLAREAERMQGSEIGVRPLSLSERKDEVGLLAKRMNGLIRRIQEQEASIGEQKRSEALVNVASQVAHDIRSPLSSMQAALQHLGQIPNADPKVEDVLNLLELSARRLTGIADDLLQKYQGEPGCKKVFSLHAVLDELVGEYQARDPSGRLRFVKKYASQAISICGDRAKLQRAFGNIIKNAVEAMEGNGEITVATARLNGTVQVSFADTGPGIPPDQLKSVLEGGLTVGKQGGHGIGMKVVRETIEAFGGKLHARSEWGRGATFRIELPFHPVEEAFRMEVSAGSAPILVVDDDGAIRAQWRMVFQEKGLESLLCESYEEMVRRNIPATGSRTAVVDYHFDNSGKNGADVVRHLQRSGVRNIVLCTAEYWKPSVQKLAAELGVTLCPKPLPKIEIRRVDQKKSKGHHVLVIDDDEGIRLSWEVKQEKLGIGRLDSYPSLEAVLANGIDLASVDLAFVDKNMDGSQYTGAQVVNILKQKGVPKVIVASGEDCKKLQADPLFAKADFILGEKLPESLAPFFPG
ncbi:MAG: HAMP domain-containing histidine kinase [Deltaproteobacteria bacterium]|nr:HAMP domain-containing histidine kinase [Deltaproteobacteria bacterium]